MAEWEGILGWYRLTTCTRKFVIFVYSHSKLRKHWQYVAKTLDSGGHIKHKIVMRLMRREFYINKLFQHKEIFKVMSAQVFNLYQHKHKLVLCYLTLRCSKKENNISSTVK